MVNPWIKKNPAMSLWLSAFNQSANAARGHVAAQAQRQTTALMTKGFDDTLRLWSGAWLWGAPPARRKKRR